MVLRLTASDPRYQRYNELQMTLAIAANAHCHHNLRRYVGDPLVWRTVHLPALRGAVEREMRAVRDGGMG